MFEADHAHEVKGKSPHTDDDVDLVNKDNSESKETSSSPTLVIILSLQTRDSRMFKSCFWYDNWFDGEQFTIVHVICVLIKGWKSLQWSA